MAELHGLLTRKFLARHVKGARHRSTGQMSASTIQKKRRKDTKPGDEVRAR